MKPISFQPKASVICSVTTAMFFKKLNVIFQHIGHITKEYLNSAEKNRKELKYSFNSCVNYFLRYYLMMQHQPIVKRVNGVHEWAHSPISSLSLLLVQTQVARWKIAGPEQLTCAHLYLEIAKPGSLFHGYSGGMLFTILCGNEVLI